MRVDYVGLVFISKGYDGRLCRVSVYMISKGYDGRLCRVSVYDK